jgi:hypothetical protein
MAGLPADARVGIVSEGPGLLQALMQEEPQGQSRVLSDLNPMTVLAPELRPFVASVAPLTTHEQAVCAMPFALTVR